MKKKRYKKHNEVMWVGIQDPFGHHLMVLEILVREARMRTDSSFFPLISFVSLQGLCPISTHLIPGFHSSQLQASTKILRATQSERYASLLKQIRKVKWKVS
jgi:hypothetical protein